MVLENVAFDNRTQVNESNLHKTQATIASNVSKELTKGYEKWRDLFGNINEIDVPHGVCSTEKM